MRSGILPDLAASFPGIGMPIYEYRCAACGFQNEYLQKVSDPLLAVCPQCGKDTFKKLLTTAGFQLKGSGWYATDFKGGAKPAAEPASSSESSPKAGTCGNGGCGGCGAH